MKTRLIAPKLKHELWNLFAWVGILKEVTLIGCECSDYEMLLSFDNKLADFTFQFAIDDLVAIKKLNQLCCMWANSALDVKKDAAGQSIHDIDSIKQFASY